MCRHLRPLIGAAVKAIFFVAFICPKSKDNQTHRKTMKIKVDGGGSGEEGTNGVATAVRARVWVASIEAKC